VSVSTYTLVTMRGDILVFYLRAGKPTPLGIDSGAKKKTPTFSFPFPWVLTNCLFLHSLRGTPNPPFVPPGMGHFRSPFFGRTLRTAFPAFSLKHFCFFFPFFFFFFLPWPDQYLPTFALRSWGPPLVFCFGVPVCDGRGDHL